MAVAAFLRQGTAAGLSLGPFLSSADGDTPVINLTILAADVLLSKNGGALAAKQEPSACSHQAQGVYACAVNAADLNTPGVLSLYVHVAGALYVRHDYLVMPAAVWDALFSSALLPVDASPLLTAPNAIDGFALADALRIIAGLVAGLVSGARTGVETFKGLDESTTVAIVNADANGNRTAVTYLP